jgi:hypothetical protein
MTKEKGRVVCNGMGGFLCPPTHPMHTKSVETDLRRRKENRGCMSLEAAVGCDWLDDATRAAVRTVLNSWQKPALDSPEVQEWILQVLGYFKGCYNFGNPDVPENWYAAKLSIRQAEDCNPMDHADQHAGVHLIRKYYPEFTPTPEHFALAYWGQKPENRP